VGGLGGPEPLREDARLCRAHNLERDVLSSQESPSISNIRIATLGVSARRRAAITTPATRRRRPEELRRLLLDTAIQEFSARGYAATTNKDIAEAAGVSIAVLYRQFTSKTELFCEAVLAPLVEFLDRFRADWQRHREIPVDFEALLRMYIGDVFTALSEHRGALSGIAGAASELPDEVKLALREAFDNTFQQLDMLAQLEAHRHDWYSADGLELVQRVLVSALLGMITYDWLLTPKGDTGPGDQLLDSMSKLGAWGFARTPPPGRR
jgi:AcrR family transcriptional regulator